MCQHVTSLNALRRAAKAREAGDLDRAMRLARRAISGGSLTVEARGLCELALVAEAREKLEDSNEIAQRAEAAARRSDDSATLGLVLAKLSFLEMRNGREARVTEMLREAEAQAIKSGDAEAIIETSANLGEARRAAGDLPAARERAERAVAAARAEPHVGRPALRLVGLAFIELQSGEVQAAERALDEASRFLDEDTTMVRTMWSRAVGWARIEAGNRSAGIRSLQEARRLAAASRHEHLRTLVLDDLSRQLASEHDFESLRCVCEEWLEIVRRTGTKSGVWRPHLMLAGCLMELGDYSSATAAAETALHSAIEEGEPSGMADSGYILGAAQMASRHPIEAYNTWLHTLARLDGHEPELGARIRWRIQGQTVPPRE